jgi:hypothetical protein
VSSVVKDSFIAFEATRLLDTGDNQDIAIFNNSAASVPATIIITAWGNQRTGPSYHGRNVVCSTIRFYLDASVPLGEEKDSLEYLSDVADGVILVTAKNFLFLRLNHTMRESV